MGLLLEQITKEEFDMSMGNAYPVVGSVVRVSLAGAFSHTGIYVGENRIVEITEVNGKALVQLVTPKQFLKGNGGDLSPRTGRHIKVASAKCAKYDYLYALGSQDIADRALEAVGSSRGEYYVLCNNCHQFTRYCITGIDDEASTPWTVSDIDKALQKKFGVCDVYWCGVGNAFPDCES